MVFIIYNHIRTYMDKESNNKISEKEILSQSDLQSLVWLTTEEAAVYLRKSANAIRILVHKKVLKCRKFARRLYFKREELDALLDGVMLHGGV